MDLSKINTSVLREMLKLSERKESLLYELKKLENEILSHLTASTKKNGQLARKKSEYLINGDSSTNRKRAARGMMKNQILAVLTEAGATGMKVPHISKKIGAKNANVHVWFSSVGKKLPEIERIGAGHFRIRQES